MTHTTPHHVPLKERVPDKALMFDGYLIITKDACHTTQGEILLILQAEV